MPVLKDTKSKFIYNPTVITINTANLYNSDSLLLISFILSPTTIKNYTKFVDFCLLICIKKVSNLDTFYCNNVSRKMATPSSSLFLVIKSACDFNAGVALSTATPIPAILNIEISLLSSPMAIVFSIGIFK